MYPANIVESDEKVDWLYRELERVLHEHQDIEKICIKTNEYTQSAMCPPIQAARKLDRPEPWIRYVITRHGAFSLTTRR